MSFKVGDKVIFISKKIRVLEYGKVYTVDTISYMDNRTYLRFLDLAYGFDSDLFIPATPLMEELI